MRLKSGKHTFAYAKELEEVLAAVWAHIPVNKFFRLPAFWQNKIMAAYRVNQRIEFISSQL